jgi:DNA replication protein DnaC
VTSALREILVAGDGPVSAFDQGLEVVRSRVPARLLACCDQWTAEQGGLVLTGPSEAGKTMALLALAWRLHDLANQELPPYAAHLEREPSCPVVWVQALKLARLRDTWRYGHERPLLEVACEEAPVLVIDDLLFAGHRVDVILEVAAVRLNYGRVTLTSSGFSQEVLIERLGDAGFRRLMRAGKSDGEVLVLTGKPR